MTPSEEGHVKVSRRQVLGAAAVGAGALVVAGCGGSGSKATSSSPTATTAPSKRGGTFRFGTSDGSTADSLDTLLGDASNANIVRSNALYDTLVRVDNKTFEPTLHLADELQPASDLSYWTVRVRAAEWHDGKPVTADDVIYSLRRILNPKAAVSDAPILRSIDPKRLKKLDSRTVRINLHYPDISLPAALRNQGCSIVPVGFDPKKPIGSGPFKYKSFTPGQQSTFVRNDNYWQSGLPYLDELQVIDFADPGTTRVNALVGGQIDGAERISFSLAPTVQAASSLGVIVSKAYQRHTWEMRMDTPPFNDVRVRQAFRLIVGRPQIVEQAFGGDRFATVANDWPGFQDPLYDHSIPQRTQDIEQAKSLLKQAGREGLTVQLAVSPLAPGVVETAQVWKQQAQAAGVTININNVADSSTYYTKYAFGSAPFKFDYFPTETIWEHLGFSLVPGAPYNISQWKNAHWSALVRQAQGTPDEAKRKELMGEAQKIFWDTGTQGIFAFYNSVDAHSTRFTGFVPSISGLGLNGLYFDNVGLA